MYPPGEKELHKALKNFFVRGAAYDKGIFPEDVDEYDLDKGTEIEMEHTDDPIVAMKIALDHLAEHPRYYDALEEMEDALQSGEYD